MIKMYLHGMSRRFEEQTRVGMGRKMVTVWGKSIFTATVDKMPTLTKSLLSVRRKTKEEMVIYIK